VVKHTLTWLGRRKRRLAAMTPSRGTLVTATYAPFTPYDTAPFKQATNSLCLPHSICHPSTFQPYENILKPQSLHEPLGNENHILHANLDRESCHRYYNEPTDIHS